MPIFRIEALEKFVVRTVYQVEADTPQQAEELCKSGEVGYDENAIEEGDEEWLETASVEISGESF
ncbi:MAG: hypothetical protein H6822_22205 [Planctomycetaceae bacterium]|nr:hypothetical protein [Planctomycetaceae bacterium]